MRKFLFSISILVAVNTFGQVAPPAPQAQQGMPNMGPVFIVAVQMETDTLKNGQDTIRLKEETVMEMKQAMAAPDYTVVLTPRGTCGPLNLYKTASGYFIVKTQKGSAADGIFDYVVFAKQRRPMMPMHPHPPGGQQPPAPPQQH